jgi:hypothetical protein
MAVRYKRILRSRCNQSHRTISSPVLTGSKACLCTCDTFVRTLNTRTSLRKSSVARHSGTLWNFMNMGTSLSAVITGSVCIRCDLFRTLYDHESLKHLFIDTLTEFINTCNWKILLCGIFYEILLCNSLSMGTTTYMYTGMSILNVWPTEVWNLLGSLKEEALRSFETLIAAYPIAWSRVPSYRNRHCRCCYDRVLIDLCGLRFMPQAVWLSHKDTSYMGDSLVALYSASLDSARFTNMETLWSSGQSSWLQIRRPGFDSRKKAVGLERGPLSLVKTTEELLDRKVAASV